MHLSEHSLRQIDEAYVQSLEVEALRGLSVRLLADLKDARDRLNQGPDTSSRPPSSRAPWDRGDDGPESDAAADVAEDEPDSEPADAKPESAEPPSAEAKPADAKPADAKPADAKPARKPGKQPGAPGIGRTQVFQANAEQPHYPDACAGCGRPLAPAGAVAYTGFQAVDLRWDDPARPGLTLWVVDHRYYETPCACGHRTRAGAGQGVVDPLLAGIELSEWRLVGPGLAALIVALAFRFRLSRARIREFLGEWLGLKLSIGTIHQTLHEAGAAVAPAEEELVQAVLASALLHADETSWPEATADLVALGLVGRSTATLYYVAGRGKELVENVLDGFGGWLMSDGWMSYRHYPHRLRCWAHLIRKARGLAAELRPRGPRLRPARAGDLGGADGGGVRRPRRSAPDRFVDTIRTGRDRVARHLRATPGQRPRQNPRLGGGVAQRLGRHLPGAEPSRTAVDQQRRPSAPCGIG